MKEAATVSGKLCGKRQRTSFEEIQTFNRGCKRKVHEDKVPRVRLEMGEGGDEVGLKVVKQSKREGWR